jgi:hypothetical protein
MPNGPSPLLSFLTVAAAAAFPPGSPAPWNYWSFIGVCSTT